MLSLGRRVHGGGLTLHVNSYPNSRDEQNQRVIGPPIVTPSTSNITHRVCHAVVFGPLRQIFYGEMTHTVCHRRAPCLFHLRSPGITIPGRCLVEGSAAIHVRPLRCQCSLCLGSPRGQVLVTVQIRQGTRFNTSTHGVYGAASAVILAQSASISVLRRFKTVAWGLDDFKDFRTMQRYSA